MTPCAPGSVRPPFRKGPPKLKPKTPGRKAGEQHGTHGHRPPPPPDQIHERHEAKLPDACPHCHEKTLVETGTAEQFQTEIPRTPIHRRFTVHLGRCRCCGKTVQGRHPLQTPDAPGAAASQLGGDAQAAATELHTRFGLSHGKVAIVFDSLFGIKLTRGASCQIGLRMAAKPRTRLQAHPRRPQGVDDDRAGRNGVADRRTTRLAPRRGR
ncbi:MAG: hypothetical protein U0791_10085 [Gemmataceae bacterium]